MSVKQRQHHLLERRRARQKIELLEYEAERFVAQRSQLVGRQRGDVASRNFQSTGRRRIEPADEVHHRRFSGTRSAHDGDEVSRLYFHCHDAVETRTS